MAEVRCLYHTHETDRALLGLATYLCLGRAGTESPMRALIVSRPCWTSWSVSFELR